MEHWLWIILAALFFECKGEDKVIQPAGDVTAAEGDTVTLGCTFETTDAFPRLFWYKKEEGSFPKIILRRFTGSTEQEEESRFTATLKEKSVPLKIQKLQLSDSAVYYCALRPQGGTGKLYFGKGTKLIVETGTEYKPAYFKVGEGENSVCLATGFSRHKATIEHEKYRKEFNETKAVAISPNLDLYNQVIFPEDGGEKCEAGGTEGKKPCTDTLVPDEKVNLMSLTILGLRVIFIKTIIFNILLTLRLWMSQ